MNGQRPEKNSYFLPFALLIIAILAFGVYKIFNDIVISNPDIILAEKPVVSDGNSGEKGENSGSNQSGEKSVEELMWLEIEQNFDKVSATVADTKCGDLLLVNNQNAYDFSAKPTLFEWEEPVSIYSLKTRDYVVSYTTETLRETAILSLNSMIADFAAATGKKDLIILDSIRTYEDQQRIYDSKGSSIATLPGHSEHHTGLAFDISLYIDEKIVDFDGTGDYEWLLKNCHKYGYILRYPEDKYDVTGISYEPWHFRYVGPVHASYMHQNGLCLEEYVELLKNYPVNSGRLSVTLDDGTVFSIYSCPVSVDGAEIYLPKDVPYTISGDNAGNIIVAYSPK